MWPFAGSKSTSREAIRSKRAHRDDALKHAPAFSAEEHQKYLNATGDFISREN